MKRTEQELERISAALDGALSDAEQRAFDAALADDPALQTEWDELRLTRSLLNDIPAVTPPRSFTLDPHVYGRRSLWMSPLFRFSGVLGALLVVVLVSSSLWWANLSDSESAALPMNSATEVSNVVAMEEMAVPEAAEMAMEAAPALEVTEAPAAEPTEELAIAMDDASDMSSAGLEADEPAATSEFIPETGPENAAGAAPPMALPTASPVGGEILSLPYVAETQAAMSRLYTDSEQLELKIPYPGADSSETSSPDTMDLFQDPPAGGAAPTDGENRSRVTEQAAATEAESNLAFLFGIVLVVGVVLTVVAIILQRRFSRS